MSSALRMTEDDLKACVLDYAALRGWLRVHIRPAETKRGWRTAYEGDSGLPDVILARRGRIILAELKSDAGKPTDQQLAWIAAAGTNGFLWTPEQWWNGAIFEVLR